MLKENNPKSLGTTLKLAKKHKAFFKLTYFIYRTLFIILCKANHLLTFLY